MHKLHAASSVLVTGATGFIGTYLVAGLLKAGCPVTALTLPEEAQRLPVSVRAVEGNITDAAQVRAAFDAAQPAYVFHLAAVGVADPGLPFRESCRINVGGVINVLEAAHGSPAIQQLILVGSSYEYGARRSDDDLDPFNAYSASKAAGWAYARAAYNTWQLPVVWVRPFQAYGPGQRPSSLVPAAIQAALRNEDFPMTPGQQQRDFIYISDVIQGLLAVMQSSKVAGRSLDLGTGRLYRICDVVERIWQLTGSTGRILSGAYPYRPGEVPAIPANYQRTRLLTGWEAKVSLDEGLQRTIDALRQEMA